MKADRWRVAHADKRRRQDVLAGVLLHVIETAGAIDFALDNLSHRNHVINEVQHGTIVIAIGHVEDGTATEVAEIVRLSSRRGIEGCAIKHHENAPIARASFDDRRRKAQQRAVVVVETFGHYDVLLCCPS
jgi:hypothetical protein